MFLEKNKETDEENNKENRYVKNSVDYSYCEHSHIGVDCEDEKMIDFEEDDLNELAILGFFNDFTLLDIGIHDLIREIYFED